MIKCQKNILLSINLLNIFFNESLSLALDIIVIGIVLLNLRPTANHTK